MRPLDGTQPTLRQSPPNRFRSTSATLAPSPAAPAALTNPAVPPPMTTRLYFPSGFGFTRPGARTLSINRWSCGSSMSTILSNCTDPSMELRSGMSGFALRLLLSIAQSLACDPRDDHHYRNTRCKTDVLQNLPVKIRAYIHLSGDGITRGGAEIDEQEHRWKHAKQITENISTGSYRRKTEKIVEQHKRKDRAQAGKQNHLEALFADRLIQRAKFRICRRPLDNFLPKKTAREQKGAKRAEIGAGNDDEKSGFQAEQSPRPDRDSAAGNEKHGAQNVNQHHSDRAKRAESFDMTFKNHEPLAYREEKKSSHNNGKQ